MHINFQWQTVLAIPTSDFNPWSDFLSTLSLLAQLLLSADNLINKFELLQLQKCNLYISHVCNKIE